jgi:hypothetical protein
MAAAHSRPREPRPVGIYRTSTMRLLTDSEPAARALVLRGVIT